MRLADVVRLLDEIAPPAEAEPWDNVGLLVGDPEAPVRNVLFTIDYTGAVAKEAEDRGADLVVAYHPPLFQPVRRLLSSSLVYRAIRAGTAIYSPHTALDVAVGGTNDVLADVVGLAERRALRPRAAGPHVGLGRIGSLRAPASRAELIVRIKAGLGLERALVAGPEDGAASVVAVSAGSCGDLYEDAIAAGADLYLTGEMRHHDALACARAGMTVVSVLHSNSERKAQGAYRDRLLAVASGLSVAISAVDRDPFTIA